MHLWIAVLGGQREIQIKGAKCHLEKIRVFPGTKTGVFPFFSSLLVVASATALPVRGGVFYLL